VLARLGPECPYVEAIGEAFDGGINYAMLVKICDNDSANSPERCYSPQPASALKKALIGNPDPDLISSSYVERQNLTMRRDERSFKRLTNTARRLKTSACAVSVHAIARSIAAPARDCSCHV
jgi:hypothetical protein